MTLLSGTANFHNYNGTQDIRLGKDGETTVSNLFFKGAEFVSFSLTGTNYGQATIEIYNMDGKLIHSKHYNLNNYLSGPNKFNFSFDNELIGKIILITTDGGGLGLDDISWNTIEDPNVTNHGDNNINDDMTHILVSNEINDITVKIRDLVEYGQKDLFIDDGKTQLMVNGNQGDTVRLEDILPEGSEQNGWAEQAGTVTIAGTQYHVWSNGDAELLVQDGVKTELV